MADADSTPGRAPAFQFYPKDFLSDRNVVLMSMQERGVYITLICYAWDSPLPSDPSQLARLCGVPLAAFRKLWPVVGACFREQDGGLVHPRLEREREKQAEFKARQAENGRKGGRPKKNPPESHEKPTAFERVPETETQTEAKKSSASSSAFASSSADFRQERIERVPTLARRGIGSGVMAGMLPRDHLRHSWCGRVCVPEFLHGQFVSAVGGADADAQLRAFYAETFRAIADDAPVESDAPKFWRPRVSARWPSAPVQGVSKLTTALAKASEW